MRKMMKTGMVFFMAMLVLMTQHVTADAKAKVLNKKIKKDCRNTAYSTQPKGHN